MYITNNDYETIKAAVTLLPKEKLSIQDQKIVSSAERVLLELKEKKKKDNERISAYIADKRKENKFYARTPYIKKGDKKNEVWFLVW